MPKKPSYLELQGNAAGQEVTRQLSEMCREGSRCYLQAVDHIENLQIRTICATKAHILAEITERLSASQLLIDSAPGIAPIAIDQQAGNYILAAEDLDNKSDSEFLTTSLETDHHCLQLLRRLLNKADNKRQARQIASFAASLKMLNERMLMLSPGIQRH